jgi:two-component system cell cycle response regulator DivK
LLTIYLNDKINYWIYFHKMLYPKHKLKAWPPFSPAFVPISSWPAAEMTNKTARPAVSRNKILVVEDNELSMKLVNDLLEFHDYEIFKATRGADAVRITREARPDLILLNLQLPDMSGLEVAHTLKADETTRAIPIVAVTAFAMRGDEERARAAGCDGYVPKPIRIQEFIQTVATFLGSSG